MRAVRPPAASAVPEKNKFFGGKGPGKKLFCPVLFSKVRKKRENKETNNEMALKKDNEKIFEKSRDFWLTLRRGMAIIIKQSFLGGSCLRLCWNW